MIFIFSTQRIQTHFTDSIQCFYFFVNGCSKNEKKRETFLMNFEILILKNYHIKNNKIDKSFCVTHIKRKKVYEVEIMSCWKCGKKRVLKKV